MASRSLPSMSSASQGKKPPPRPVLAASMNISLPDERKLGDSPDSDTRRHTPSSIPRVKPSSKSQPEWAKLSQKITFDENSPPSSSRSTPAQWSAPRSKPMAPHSIIPRQLVSSGQDVSVPQTGVTQPQQADMDRDKEEDDEEDKGEEEEEEEQDKELKTSISISDVLSRLETVRKYMKDASAIQKQLKKQPDSQSQLQLSKLSVLLEQLQQQEASYLNILLTIMANDSEKASTGVYDDDEDDEKDEEDEEEEKEEEEEDLEAAAGDDSLSLQAEMAWQLEQRKREKDIELSELQALREQHALLTKLLEQKSQLEALENRQARLMAQQKHAEEHLSQLTAEPPQHGAMASEADRQQQQPGRKSEAVKSPGEIQLMAARAEKAQLDDLLARVRAAKASGGRTGGAQASPSKGGHPAPVKGSLPVSVPPGAGNVSSKVKDQLQQKPVRQQYEASNSPLSNRVMVASVPEQSHQGHSQGDIVAGEDTLTDAAMMKKMKMVEEARSRLFELQNLLSVLQSTSSGTPESSKLHVPQAAQTSPTKQKQQQQTAAEDKGKDERRKQYKTPSGSSGARTSKSNKESFLPQPTSVDSLGTNNQPNSTDQSLLEEYEQHVRERQKELEALRNQREELLQLEAMLQDLLISQEEGKREEEEEEEEEETDDEATYSESREEKVMAELQRQRQLRDELMKKAERLQQLKGALSKYDSGAAQNDSAFYGAVDTTAATWGGSTMNSELSTLDNTQELGGGTNADAAVASGSTMSSTATYTKPSPDLPQYRVDRHTPRTTRAQRRSFDSPEDQAPSTGKKIKLEAENSTSTARGETRGRGNYGSTRHQSLGTSNLSAAWPSVIFSSHQQAAAAASRMAEEGEEEEDEEEAHAEQQPSPQSRPPLPPQLPPLPPPPASASSYTELLHHQLSSTTMMCSELLQNHSSLLQALHQQLSALPFIQDQLIWLNQYYDNVRNYHQYLAAMFVHIQDQTNPDDTLRESARGREHGNTAGEDARNPTQEDPLLSSDAREGAGPVPNIHQPPPPPPPSWPASLPSSWPSSLQQSPFVLFPPPPHYSGLPYMSPSPYRGTGQPDRWWWGLGQEGAPHGRPASRQAYTRPDLFSGTTTGGGVAAAESVGGASMQVQHSSVASGPSVSSHSWQAPPTSSAPVVQQNGSPRSMFIPEISVLQPAASSAFKPPVSSQSGKAASSGTTRGVGGEGRGGAFGLQLPEGDAESQSSIPISLPEEHIHARGAEEGTPEDFSVFDALRDTIYSEVAAVIAGNEGRPHFLVELFRELQQLKTDYLRQRALFLIQDLVTKYLTDEAVQTLGQNWLEEESTTEDDEGFVGALTAATARGTSELTRGNSGRFDYTEPVESASSVSTPVEPFASDSLGDTMIQVKSPTASRGPPKASSHVDANTQDNLTHLTLQSNDDEDLESESLDEEIKAIMMEVIPLLKGNLNDHCTSDFLQSVQECVMSVILKREEPQAEEKEEVQEALDVFARQLEASLIAALGKYEGKHTKECGENLLVDVSEVLFREMAFFKLIKKPLSPQSQEFRSVTSNSQTTTDAESYTTSPLRPLASYVVSAGVMQSPASSVVKSLLEEEEGLGKTRDDELAKTWDSSKERPPSPESDQEDQFVVVSASEAKLSESSESGSTKGHSTEKVGMVSVTLSANGVANSDPVDENEKDKSDIDEEDGSRPESQQLKALGDTQGVNSDPLVVNGNPPVLTSIPIADIETQMRNEQSSMEGATAVLETTEHHQELAGDGEELPRPVSTSEP